MRKAIEQHHFQSLTALCMSRAAGDSLTCTHRLLEIIACPVCNGKLWYNQEKQELICKLDNLAFPLRDGIPVLLETEARVLTADESKS